jgi:fused signal recognition particle receptor
VSAERGKPRGLFNRIFGGGAAKPGADDPQTAEAIDMPDASGRPELDSASSLSSDLTDQPLGEQEESAPEPGHVAATPMPAAPAQTAKKGWFQRLKDGLAKTSSKLSDGITGLFTKRKLDGATLEDLEDLLIQADLGMETAHRITDAISKGRYEKGISADEVRAILSTEVEKVLDPVAKPLVIGADHKPHVVLVVGVNGTGKTTTIGKLAARERANGRRVVLAAADTFRAAAIDQLRIWARRTDSEIVAHAPNADPAAVVFDALDAAVARHADVLIADTAGRLHTKANLMDELSKVRRVIDKRLPGARVETFFVLDATTGQNGLAQATAFHEAVGLTGVVLTKLDSTAKGGIVFAIEHELGVPVRFIGVGEKADDLLPFDPQAFVAALLE